MILETLKKIKSAEQEAKKSIEDAKTETVAIINGAKANAEKILADKKEAARNMTEKMINDSVEDARKECQNIVDKWEKETEEIRKEAGKNLAKAKEFIVRSVLG